MRRRECRQRLDIVGDEVGPGEGRGEQMTHGEALQRRRAATNGAGPGSARRRGRAGATGASARKAATECGSKDMTATWPAIGRELRLTILASKRRSSPQVLLTSSRSGTRPSTSASRSRRDRMRSSLSRKRDRAELARRSCQRPRPLAAVSRSSVRSWKTIGMPSARALQVDLDGIACARSPPAPPRRCSR